MMLQAPNHVQEQGRSQLHMTHTSIAMYIMMMRLDMIVQTAKKTLKVSGLAGFTEMKAHNLRLTRQAMIAMTSQRQGPR